MSLTIIINLSEHFDLPVSWSPAKREVAYWFCFRVLVSDVLHGLFAYGVRVFIAVLSSFGASRGKSDPEELTQVGSTSS